MVAALDPLAENAKRKPRRAATRKHARHVRLFAVIILMMLAHQNAATAEAGRERALSVNVRGRAIGSQGSKDAETWFVVRVSVTDSLCYDACDLAFLDDDEDDGMTPTKYVGPAGGGLANVTLAIACDAPCQPIPDRIVVGFLDGNDGGHTPYYDARLSRDGTRIVLLRGAVSSVSIRSQPRAAIAMDKLPASCAVAFAMAALRGALVS